jgi:riboflavin synthase
MFTGIVEEVGRLRSIAVGKSEASLEIEASVILEGTRVGDSIDTAGVCLTVTRMADDRFWADAMAETIRRTTLGAVTPGTPLNLERALTLSSRLGGHLVTGHVDGVGRVERIRREGETTVLVLAIPPEVAVTSVAQGSLAVDGISLTIVDLRAGRATVSLIPHTVANTTFARLRVGAIVNLEADIIGKYVRAYLGGSLPAEGLTWEKLGEAGFV